MAAHSHSHSDDPPDTMGQLLSAVCAVHCVSTPLVVALAPAAGSVLGGVHPVLLVLVIGVALWAFVPAYRCHKKTQPFWLALVGVSFLAAASIVFHDDLKLDTALSLVGAAFMMVAHWRNRVLLRAAH